MRHGEGPAAGPNARASSHGGERDIPIIGVLADDAMVRTEIARQLERVGELVLLESERLAATGVADSVGRMDLLVAASSDLRRGELEAWLGAVDRWPAVPVLPYERVVQSSIAPLLEALEAGRCVDCAVRPFEPVAPLVRRVLREPLPPVVAPLLARRLLAGAPRGLRPFLFIAACKAPSRRGVQQLARWSGVSGRTIERRLRAAGWAPARVVLQACRALDVLWFMTQYGWPASRIRRVCGIRSASAVTRLTERYVGTTPRAVHEGVRFGALLDAALRRIRGLEMNGEEW